MESLAHVVSAIAGIIIIAGFLWGRIKAAMGITGAEYARRVFQWTGSLEVTLPGPPSPEFLPTPPNRHDGLTHVTASDITTWEDIPSGGWSKRKLIAVLQILQGPRIGVVKHKTKRQGYFENGTPIDGYDLVLGLDVSSWRKNRPVPGPNNSDRIRSTLGECHWVYAGEQKQLQWRQYWTTHWALRNGPYPELHPRIEAGWALYREGHVLCEDYFLPQEPTNRSRHKVPRYVILETEEDKFQAVERTIYEINERILRRGKRTIHWQGPERTSFPEAVDDLFQKHELNCPSVYRRNLEAAPESFPPS